jgi:hypothetical protein
MVTRVGSSTAPSGVVTVADLLTRYAPDPLTEAEPPTDPVSVGSLLRREGRAPHAQDRPLTPRSRPASDDEARRGSGALVRRSAIAAGTLLAAGSVFGATVVMDSSSTGAEDRQPSGGYAGEGRLDLPSIPDGTVPTVVDTAAQTERLDAGGAPPMSWLDVAFPSTGGTRAGTGTTGGSPSASDTVRTPSSPTSTPGQADDTVRGGSGGSSDDGSGPTSGGSSGDDQGDGDQGGGDQGDGDQGDGGLGSGLQGVGAGVGGPVGGVVGGLGNTVSDVGGAVAGDEPSVIGGLAGGLLR